MKLVDSRLMRNFQGVRDTIVATTLALFAAGCVEEGPAEPTPPPPLAGAYVLTVDASGVCRLPISRFVWEVEATSSGTATAAGGTMLVRATLPAGDATVDLSLTAGLSAVASGTLAARAAAFGDETLRLTLGGPTRGTITVGPGGRGHVTDGSYNGTIALAPVDDPDPRSAGSCAAADHRWTLVPR